MSRTASEKITPDLLTSRPPWETFGTPEALRWTKDDTGRYVQANTAFVRFSGFTDQNRLIGCRDEDLVQADLSHQYVEDDTRVRVTGRAITHQVELVRDADGDIRWYMCTKTPVPGRRGKAIATAGTMCPIEHASTVFPACQPLSVAIRQMMEGFTGDLSVEALASAAGISPSHFTRRFKQLFQLTPHQLLLRVRIRAACQMLVHSDLSVVQIALWSRFYDQSHFVRHFGRQMQLSPSDYRRRYWCGNDPQVLAFFDQRASGAM